MTRSGACPHPSEAAVCQQCATERRAEERAKARTDGGVGETVAVDEDADEGGFSTMIPADVLEATINAVDCLVNECKIHLNEDGLRIAAVDPANVGMVDLSLDAAACDYYDAHGGTIGINLERLGDVVGMAASGDLVHLDLDAETRKLHIDAGGLSYTLALIDPEAIRQEPDIPELDLPATVRLPAGELERGVTAADLCSDHITLGADDDAFLMTAEGDTDTARYNLDGDSVIDANCPEQCEAIFSLEYMEELVDPIPKAAEVTCTIDTDFPILMSWETADGHLNVGQMCAPRIQSE